MKISLKVSYGLIVLLAAFIGWEIPVQAATIDSYTAATTPLAGTERVPGNQGANGCASCTVKITSQSIANLATKTTVGLSAVTNDVQTMAAIVPNTAPAAGQILVGNAGGTAYAPVTGSGSCTISSAGVFTCSGGITALTGDVTASGSGSVAATLATSQPAVHTWALGQTFTVAPTFTDASGSRTALGLGALSTVTPGTGVATFLTTPSSANFFSAITDETGSGLVVGATAPTLTAPVTLTGVAGSSALTINGATQTASFPMQSIAQTWNNSGVTFTGWLENVTNTASAANSLLADWQIGGVSRMKLDKAATLTLTPTTAAGTVPALSVLSSGSAFVKLYDNGTAIIDSDTGTGTNILALKYAGAARFTFTYQGALTTSVTGAVIGPSAAGGLQLGAASTGLKMVYVDYTNTGTVGAVTINKASGRVNIAATGTSVVVTDSLVTAAAHCFANASTNDATAKVTAVVPAAGSFTIYTTAVTAQTSFDFFCLNAD